MRKLLAILWVLVASLAPWAGACAAPVLILQPSAALVSSGSMLWVDVQVSGLQDGGEPLLLGAVDLTIDFDAAFMAWQPSASALGSSLGNPDDLLQTVHASGLAAPGQWRLLLVSLLEARQLDCQVCAGPFLEDLQSDSLHLASLGFLATGAVSESSHSVAFSVRELALSDAGGRAIADGGRLGATVTVVPEPAGHLLVLTALAALGAVVRRRRPPSRAALLVLGAVMLPVTAADFRIAAGDTAALVQAVGIANGLAGRSTIELAEGVYTVADAAESVPGGGSHALPGVRADILVRGLGAGAVIRRADNAGVLRAWAVSGLGWLTLERITLTNFNPSGTPAESGVVLNAGTLELLASQVQDNRGWGIVNVNNGLVLLRNAVVARNRGGGIRNEAGVVRVLGGRITGNTGGDGAGILNRDVLALAQALIDSNAGANGAGLANAGTATIENTTFSGNMASGSGGGIANLREVRLLNVTIAGNRAVGLGGGIWNSRSSLPDAALLDLNNVLLAGNTETVGGASLPSDCVDNEFNVTGSHNLVQSGGCGALLRGFIVADPGLAPLADIGGATPSHALLPGSVAIDAGNPFYCVAIDQRGARRPRDGDHDGRALCDIGAVEQGPAAADLNGDGCIDRSDLAIVMASLQARAPRPFWLDLNDDGQVSVADARHLVVRFSRPGGQACR